MPALPRHPCWLALGFALLLAAAGAGRAGALAIEIVSASQTVDADAFARTGPAFDSQSRGDGREAGDPAQLALEVRAEAATEAASALATASLSAFLGPSRLSAEAATSSRALGFDEADAAGVARLQVFFRVDEAFAYVLAGLLRASGTIGTDGVALLQLAEVGSGAVLFEAEAAPLGSTPFDTTLALEPGLDYELFAVADSLSAQLPPVASGGSGFEFSLRPVPEPGTAAALALGLALLAAARRGGVTRG